MTAHRVVVTGVGALSPIGLSVDEYWENLLRGVSGVGPITAFDASELAVRIAAEVKGFQPNDFMEAKAARRMGRFAQFSLAASRQALEHSGLKITPHNEYEVGVIVATGGGGCAEIMDETVVLIERGPERVNPLFVPAMISNMASCQVSIHFGLKHNPQFVKVNRAKWEVAIKTLPKQVAPYLMLRHHTITGSRDGLREAALLGKAWGMTPHWIVQGITGTAMYFTGFDGLYTAYEAVDDLLEAWSH